MDSTLSFILLAIIFVVLVSAGYAGLRAAPWVPLGRRDVERALQLAEVKSGELVIDLGAGDGRFLIAAVKQFGARAIGYECSIGPWLLGQIRLTLSGVRGSARLVFKDFFKESWQSADVITCFLTPMAMRKVETKFVFNAKPGCRLVSYAFALPKRQPDRTDKPRPNLGRLYLYRR